MSKEEQLYEERLAKLQRLRGRGVDPYPPRFKPSHAAGESLAVFAAWEAAAADGPPPSVRVAGRVAGLRRMGRAAFLDLRDASGRIQLLCARDKLAEPDWLLLQDTDLGDFLGAEGPLFRTRAGEVTVEAHGLTMLAKALRTPPEKWHGLTDVEQRYRQRYRDLIANEEVRELFRLRSAIIAFIRRFLDDRGFMEVETPTLIEHYGGAAAQPFVTHHNALGRDLFLRVATELHLKRLVVGGFEKVYEIGHVFRNEGLSWKHSPEYTMLESYEAYADYNDVMAMVEEMVAETALATKGTTKIAWERSPEETIDLSPPWRRVTLRQALIEHAGLDIEEHAEIESLRRRLAELGLEPEAGAGWGKLVDQVLKALVEPKQVQPTFIIDYPVEHSPLAKRKPQDPRYVERFEAYALGLKFANAYTELNDPVEQRERLLEQARLRAAGDVEAEIADEDFLVALEHGMPPTGGLGIGIDRLVMLLSGRRQIREVILFPTLREKG